MTELEALRAQLAEARTLLKLAELERDQARSEWKRISAVLAANPEAPRAATFCESCGAPAFRGDHNEGCKAVAAPRAATGEVRQYDGHAWVRLDSLSPRAAAERAVLEACGLIPIWRLPEPLAAAELARRAVKP